MILSHGTTNLFAAIVPAAMRHADPWLMTPALVAAHLLLSLVSHRKRPLLQPAVLVPLCLNAREFLQTMPGKEERESPFGRADLVPMEGENENEVAS